jgi:hypothetical protein
LPLSINLKLTRHRIKAVQTISHAGQPQRAARVFRDGPVLAWTRDGAPVGPELFCFRIEPIKGVVAPDPQRTVAIDIQAFDDIAAQASGGIAIVIIEPETACSRIEAVESVAPFSKPEIPGTVLRNSMYRPENQTARHALADAPSDLPRSPIESIKTAEAPDP